MLCSETLRLVNTELLAEIFLTALHGASAVAANTHPIWSWVSDKLVGPAVVGAIVATLGSRLYALQNEHFKGRRDHLSKAVDALAIQLDKLFDLAIAYWSRAGLADDKAIELEIEYRLATVDTLVRICAVDLWESQQSTGPILVGKLFSATITPEFATLGRLGNAARARLVGAAIIDVYDAVAERRSTYFRKSPKLWKFSA